MVDRNCGLYTDYRPQYNEGYRDGVKSQKETTKLDMERLEEQRDMAIYMLAQWCVDIDINGTGWDDWDENYKDAMYRPGPLRELLDKAIEEIRKQRES